MSPLLMDSGCEANTPGSGSGSGSTGENHSNTGGSEREGEVTTTKRRKKNRDAARKSRKKQTEQADELHEELQVLEQSNSALQKEISALRKEAERYTALLERHEPLCRLRGSAHSPGGAAAPRPLASSQVFSSAAPPHSLFSDRPPPSPCGPSVAPLLLDDRPVAAAILDPVLTEPPSFTNVAPPCDDSLNLLPRLPAPPSRSGIQSPPAGLTSDPGQQAAASGSLLSLLTTPSPLTAPPAAPPSPPTFIANLDALCPPEPLGDLSFLDLLEGNEWILSGTTEL